LPNGKITWVLNWTSHHRLFPLQVFANAFLCVARDEKQGRRSPCLTQQTRVREKHCAPTSRNLTLDTSRKEMPHEETHFASPHHLHPYPLHHLLLSQLQTKHSSFNDHTSFSSPYLSFQKCRFEMLGVRKLDLRIVCKVFKNEKK
jgi:hypothetical protein